MSKRKSKGFLNFRIFALVFLFIFSASMAMGQTPLLKPVYINLSDLANVSKTAPTDGQYLSYVAATGLWTPAAGAGGAPTDAHYLTDQAEAGLSAEVVVTANGKALVTAANYAAMRTLLDLESGVDFNAYDADLTTYAGITPSANVQSLLGAATYAAMRTLLDLEVGTDFNAYDADLTTWAGITPSANVQTFNAAANYAAMVALIEADMETAIDTLGNIATGNLDVSGNVTTSSYIAIEDSNEVRWLDGDTNYVGFEAPAALAGDQIWVLPAADGANTQVMQTDGAGNLTWVNNASGSMATDSLWAAAGDLAHGTGNDTATVLTLGYAGDILRVNAAPDAPYWDSPGIANTNPVVIDHAEVADDEYARFTAGGLESRTAAEVLSDIGAQSLNTVLTELTALTDPGADKLIIWNDTTKNFEYSTTIFPTATGISVGAAGNAGKLELEDATGDVLGISVGVQAGNTDYVWPTAFPASTGYALTSSDAGVLSWDSDITDLVTAATTGAAGKSELTTIAEVNAGTDTTRAITVDALAGSNLGTKTVVVKVYADDGALTLADGEGYFTVPIELDGMDLVSVGAHVYTASGGGTAVNISIYNVGNAVDMLTTQLTIDNTEKDSATAATPAVISAVAANRLVNTGDEVRIDINQVGDAATKGLEIRLGFQRVV